MKLSSQDLREIKEVVLNAIASNLHDDTLSDSIDEFNEFEDIAVTAQVKNIGEDVIISVFISEYENYEPDGIQVINYTLKLKKI